MIVQEPSTATLKRLDVSTLLSTLPKHNTTRGLLDARHTRKARPEETQLSSPFPEPPHVDTSALTKYTVRLSPSGALVAWVASVG